MSAILARTDFLSIFCRLVAILVIVQLCLLLPVTPARAAQTINTTSTTSCAAQGGATTGGNFITDFSNGTFGTASGAANQSPAVNPYPGQVTGGVYAQFYSITWGNYSYIANAVTPRNPSQHPSVTDPVYGNTGRFFASDPNTNTPVLDFTALNVTANQNYQLSFWAANSEPNGLPNNINVEVDGIVTLNTGPLQAFTAAMEWKRYSFVFNAGNRSSILIALRSLEVGNAGRDFYLDNVELRQCTLPASATGSISGTIYSDVNRDNSFQSATETVLPNVRVDLYDTRGTAGTTDDIFVSSYSSTATGSYNFSSIAINANYQLRVFTTDPDLPSGAVIGTPATIAVNLTSGANLTGRNFGFDLLRPNFAISKTSKPYTSLLTGVFSLPGQDMEYTISITNNGGTGQDIDSTFFFDALPATLTFYNGDFDGIGAATSDPILLTQSSAGLSYLYSRDVRYSNAATAPANLAACTYTPIAGYDPAVKFVCINPKGIFASGPPASILTAKFRAQIK